MARRDRRGVRLLGVGAAALLAAAALRRVGTSRQRSIDEVAPDLRTPLLRLPLEVATPAALTVARALARFGPPPVRGVRVHETTVPGPPGARDVPVTCYERPDRGRPSGALLWIHGGGMILGTPAQDHRWCSELAADLGIVVVSVDYRLAPEHPYPAAVDDCAAALAWLHASADELGVDPARIAVGGASAGGGLAAATSLRARDEGGPPIRFQLLHYPMLDDRTVLADDHEGRGTFVWTPAANRFAWTAYLGGPPSAEDDRQWAAPARAADLADLPATWVGVGTIDLFHPEDVDYAHRLRDAGVECELVEVPGMYHGADQVTPRAPTVRAYRSSMVEALRRAIG